MTHPTVPLLFAALPAQTGRAGRIHEARLCLSKSLDPVPCGRDVAFGCALTESRLDPVR